MSIFIEMMHKDYLRYVKRGTLEDALEAANVEVEVSNLPIHILEYRGVYQERLSPKYEYVPIKEINK